MPSQISAWLAENIFISDLLYKCENPEDFFLPQWQTHDQMGLAFVMYRLFNVGFYYNILYLHFRVDLPMSKKLQCMVYFTYWALIMNFIWSLLSLASSLIRIIYEISEEEKEEPAEGVEEEDDNSKTDKKSIGRLSNVFHKCQYITSSLAFDSAVMITAGYWGLVSFYEGRPFSMFTSFLHIWVFIVGIIELLVTRTPVKYVHVIYSIIFGFIYLLFAYFYYKAGGKSLNDTKYLYKMLDFEESELVCISFFAQFVFAFIARLLAVGLYHLRVKIFNKTFALDE